MLFGVFPITIRGKETRIFLEYSVKIFHEHIYLLSRFFGAKHPNKGAIAETRDYER